MSIFLFLGLLGGIQEIFTLCFLKMFDSEPFFQEPLLNPDVLSFAAAFPAVRVAQYVITKAICRLTRQTFRTTPQDVLYFKFFAGAVLLIPPLIGTGSPRMFLQNLGLTILIRQAYRFDYHFAQPNHNHLFVPPPHMFLPPPVQPPAGP